MEKKNTILDREKLSSDYIHSKQNFGKVIAGYQKLKPPVWNRNIFYGVIGISSIVLVLSVVNLSSSSSNDDQELTNKVKMATTSNDFNQPSESSPDKKLVMAVLENDLSNKKVEKKKIHSTIPKIEKNKTSDDLIEVIEPESIEDKVHGDQPLQRYKNSNNLLPNLSGVFTGEISAFEFCSSKGIECANNDYAVVSYVIQFYNGSGRDSEDINVKGSQIPHLICEKLFIKNLNNSINFTNIKAEHRVTGVVISLSSMSLKPTIK